MLIIPTQPSPNQILTTKVNGQQTTLHIYQLSTGMYMDVFNNNALVSGGILCQNLHMLIRWRYLNFTGDLLFADQQGLTDPYFSGLGSRYLLFYLFPRELPTGLQ